jgi:hypothetical protein
VLSSVATVAASLWLAVPLPQAVTAVLPAPVRVAALPPPEVNARSLPAAPQPLAAVLAVRAEAPSYSVAEAQMLMQLMAESGDPRQPAAGGLRPRTAASPAQLADPAAYMAFADQQSRAEVLAWTSGVQQIAQITAQIAQAEQRGERSGTEIDEARGALEQLQMLHSKLQREAPELLPGTVAGRARTAP